MITKLSVKSTLTEMYVNENNKGRNKAGLSWIMQVKSVTLRTLLPRNSLYEYVWMFHVIPQGKLITGVEIRSWWFRGPRPIQPSGLAELGERQYAVQLGLG